VGCLRVLRFPIAADPADVAFRRVLHLRHHASRTASAHPHASAFRARPFPREPAHHGGWQQPIALDGPARVVAAWCIIAV
jgi:hypothetical protein